MLVSAFETGNQPIGDSLMIHFDQWIQDVQVQIDNESYRAMHCRFRPAVVSDYEGLTYDMDEEAWLHDRES